VEKGGSEFRILLEATPDELASYASAKILEGIIRNRQGKVLIVPGHDGTYGKITLFPGTKETEPSKEQLRLF